MIPSKKKRSPLFVPLLIFFIIFIIFLYGPILTIMILSFQGESGGLTFPMRGVSLHWFETLFFGQPRVGEFRGPFMRSLLLGTGIMTLCVVVGTMVGQAFRYKFKGANFVFYLAISSLVVPHILISLGIGVLFDQMGWRVRWYTSGLGAHLTWTLPFALLIVLAIFNRFDKSIEEAARDLGAGEWVTFREVVLPLILPGLIGVGLFGFTMSYDEFARSAVTMGEFNTLPLEIYGMTSNATDPTLYAFGTVTTVLSLAMILSFLVVTKVLQNRADKRKEKVNAD